MILFLMFILFLKQKPLYRGIFSFVSSHEKETIYFTPFKVVEFVLNVCSAAGAIDCTELLLSQPDIDVNRKGTFLFFFVLFCFSSSSSCCLQSLLLSLIFFFEIAVIIIVLILSSVCFYYYCFLFDINIFLKLLLLLFSLFLLLLFVGFFIFFKFHVFCFFLSCLFS